MNAHVNVVRVGEENAPEAPSHSDTFSLEAEVAGGKPIPTQWLYNVARDVCGGRHPPISFTGRCRRTGSGTEVAVYKVNNVFEIVQTYRMGRTNQYDSAPVHAATWGMIRLFHRSILHM